MEDYSILMSVYCKENPAFLDEAMKSMMEQTVLTNDFVIVCDGPLSPELDAVLDRYVQLYPGIINVVRLEKNVGIGMAANISMKENRRVYLKEFFEELKDYE